MFGWLKKIGDLASHRVYEQKETALFNFRYTKISMDGKDVSADALDEGVLQQISQQSGLSIQEVRQMILGGEGASAMRDFEHLVHGDRVVTEGQIQEQIHDQNVTSGPIRRVECTGCHRTVVARKSFCMYCGEVLPEEQQMPHRNTSAKTDRQSNDVDAKFLKTDIGQTDRREDDEDRDSYVQRLRRM